jgi:hypothetical protein|tara:strand:+ start:421 stop:663 length:243 start_codon:yes stop_codon:yes gene_type:complete
MTSDNRSSFRNFVPVDWRTQLPDKLLQSVWHKLADDPGEVKACLLPVPARANEVKFDSGDHWSAIGWSASSTATHGVGFY